MKRRDLLAGTGALAAAAALPGFPAFAEALEPVCKVERAGFVNRLHKWALLCPEMGDRIDALIDDAEAVLSTTDGLDRLLEARGVCEERLGYAVSLDYLICGPHTLPNGKPCVLFTRLDGSLLPPEDGDGSPKFLQAVQEMDPRAVPGLQMAMGAMLEGRYKDARDWMRWSFEQIERPVPQI